MNQEIRYRLKVTDGTANLIRGLHPKIKPTIKAALEMIAKDSFSGKALKDDLKGLHSFRVKRYRIVYRVLPKQKLLEIVTIGPRKNIYIETFRLIQKGKRH